MDNKDRQIIKELQLNGRLTNQQLAEKVNLSASPCLRRVRNLERTGIITGYAALVDQAAYGLPITVFVQIKLQPHSLESVRAFEAEVAKIDQILDCYLMTGDQDYLLRVIVESLEAYEIFVREKIHQIPSIASISTSFAFGTVKQARSFAKVL